MHFSNKHDILKGEAIIIAKIERCYKVEPNTEKILVMETQGIPTIKAWKQVKDKNLRLKFYKI